MGVSADPGRIIGGILALFFGSCIASSAGIGGGGVNVPILLVIFGFDFNDAAFLSLLTVCGNCLCQYAVNYQRPHPRSPTRSIIYWEAATVLLPAQVMGAVIGVIFSHAVPTTLLELVSLIVLSYAIYKTYFKASHLWEAESEFFGSSNQQIEDLKEDITSGRSVSDNSVDGSGGRRSLMSDISELTRPSEQYHPNDRSKSNDRSSWFMDMTSNPVHTHAAKHDAKPAMHSSANGKSFIGGLPEVKKMEVPVTAIRFPKIVLGALGGTVVSSIVFIVIGTLACNSCSVPYYITLFAADPIMIAIIYWAVEHGKRIQKDEPTVYQLEGDLNFEKLGFIPSFVTVAIGAICSVIGIGGGELLGPLLLHYKVLPPVSSATTSILSLLNSIVAVIHYSLSGSGVAIEWCVTVFFIGLIGGGVGRTGALWVSKKYGRFSVLVYALCALLVISVLLLISSIATTTPSFSFGAVCS